MQECCTQLRALCRGFDGSDNSCAVSDTRGEKGPITHQESRCKNNLHCLKFYSRILCWILLFEFDNSLLNPSSPINSLCNIDTLLQSIGDTPPPQAVCKSSKPAEQDCLQFNNLFLTKYLSDLLLQVRGFCLPRFNKTRFQLLLLFSTADNTANFLHEDKCFSFPIGQQQGETH